MSKEEFLKIQTCVLKVNIHCDGCKQKVKKILHKIDGVYTTAIDAEQGKVTVSGNVDPATLIKKLAKSGKHAELWPSKGGNNNNQQPKNQFQKPQLESGKAGQEDNGKPQKGSGGGGGNKKGQPAPPQQQLPPQQMKGFKDLKLPQLKDLKSVKFDLPEEEDGSDYDYSDDYDDDASFDDLEGFDDDFDVDLKNTKLKPMNGPPNGIMTDKKVGGGGGGGGGGGNAKKSSEDINSQSKGEVKNGNDGKKGKNGGGNQNQGGSGGGSAGKNGGGEGNNGDGKNGGNNKTASNGGNVDKKGGEKSDAGKNPMSNPGIVDQGFPGQMGQMNMPVGQMGSIPAAPGPAAAVQGLPAGGPPPGYFQGGPMAPEMMAVANPYQQQYLAAMMQQQRMINGQDRTFQPMAYARPPPSVSYMSLQPEYTHFFSDENTSSCSIM